MKTYSLETINQEQLARFAKALGHPTRISILQFLIKLYDKKSIDTDVLFRISAILDFDFFSLYSEHMLK